MANELDLEEAVEMVKAELWERSRKDLKDLTVDLGSEVDEPAAEK